MPCTRPRHGWRSRHVNPATGKRSIVFNQREGFLDMRQTVACRQCMPCRLNQSRNWAVRCVHEASLYGDDNSFITLTYNPKHLPPGGTLVKKHFQDFMKRLKFHVAKFYSLELAGRMAYDWQFDTFNHEIPTRVYYAGEYGSKLGRPHYHAILFNLSFPDAYFWKYSIPGKFSSADAQPLFRSPTLERLWSDPKTGESMGYSSIGQMTFESAAYVARYCTKKITGDQALFHYTDFDLSTGEIYADRAREFGHGSQGIGKGWIKNMFSDVYPDDFVLLRGKKFKPPSYYDGLYELYNPTEFSIIKAKRKLDAQNRAGNNTDDRLAVREKIANLRFEKLKRGYENDF